MVHVQLILRVFCGDLIEQFSLFGAHDLLSTAIQYYERSVLSKSGFLVHVHVEQPKRNIDQNQNVAPTCANKLCQQKQSFELQNFDQSLS